ncbi:phosphohydrolase [Actibacterium mucosum KCTC 23349]|uniref:5'-deoxynucleotidase n=1 Tax=Actibacterium mucosum KCTC 23349 TaxID=1454373 RepID=A0A037ZIF2_9RHOB|nr:HD domain-containing protein [Actibacterium mucosum]KAJ55379.1 phosphohydrolase [Actibacterium mucosum KCTC 23349]
MTRLDAQLTFLREADKLKSVDRANLLMDLSRVENTAEHSWHVALCAMLFAPDFPDVDADRAIAMLLLHDLVEIDAGDHPIDSVFDADQVARAEAAAATRLFGLLPANQGATLAALWQEFEAAETGDARFAKLIDHCHPMFQTLLATHPHPEHVAVVRDNLATGRASDLGQRWPAGHAAVTTLLQGRRGVGPLWDRLALLAEADRLKSVQRATTLFDGSRNEFTGEHCWHVALFALVLAEHAIRPANAARVVRMLLLHDLVEIDAGDTPIHAGGDPAVQEAAELRAADRLFGLLPADQATEWRALWDVFEAAQSDDALFGKALDRLQPAKANLLTDGGNWPHYRVTRAQLDTRVGVKIRAGAPALWDWLEPRVDAWFARTRSAVF